MTVLVTGGMGYIGSHTCVELLEQGMDVVVIDNLVNSSEKAKERIEEIAGKTLSFYKADVRDRKKLDEIFLSHDIDCVIHFAGLKAVGESVEKPLEYYDNNLGSTITLCEAMRAHDVKKIIFSSSATVYSSDNDMPLYETSRTGKCTNPYGWTKYMCEQILRDYVKADPSWSVALLRYFNLSAHIRADLSARIRRAFRITSCRISHRPPSADLNICAFSVTTTTPPTAPECATISTLLTLHAATLRQYRTWTRTRVSLSSTSAQAEAAAFSSLCMRLKRQTSLPFRTRS